MKRFLMSITDVLDRFLWEPHDGRPLYPKACQCGGRPEVLIGETITVACPSCKLTTFPRRYHSDAIKAWNRGIVVQGHQSNTGKDG